MKGLRWSVPFLLALCCKANAQVPIAPPPTPVADAAGFAAAPAQPKTIWSFLGISCDKLRECHRKCCRTQIGQLWSSMLAPARAFSGGLIPEWCPSVPTAEDLARMKPGEVSPAEAAAAKIKADEAGAKARRAAVKFLGTVDCHYYPEAELALIAALRADRNECVRLEAAYVLGRGCCCTKRTIEALNIVITGSDKDGNPSETSERVKICAMESIQNCMGRGVAFPTPEPPEAPPAAPPELPATLSFLHASDIQQASFTIDPTIIRPVPASTRDEGKPALSSQPSALSQTGPSSEPMASRGLPTGSRSLLQLVSHTSRSLPEPAPTTVTPPPATLAPPLAQTPYMPRRINLQPIGLAPINFVP